MSLNPTEMSRKATDLAGRVTTELRAVAALARAGAIGVAMPHNLLRGLRAMTRFGAVGGGIVNAAILHGDETGVVDDLGTLSFRDLDERSNALADSLVARGLPDGATIGALCRNHRGMLDITYAAAKGGYKLLYLNTDFAGPQARDVSAREGVQMLVVDEEFLPVVEGIEPEFGTVVAWSDEAVRADGRELLETMIQTGDPGPRPAPARPGAIVILTSGTTGLPKGAPRSQPKSLAAPGAIASKIPFRSRGTVLIGPPMYHAWGLTMSILAVSTGSTLLLSRRFDGRGSR
ncbi:MAG: AMP-binding protein, partial [Aquihabitans sp.]